MLNSITSGSLLSCTHINLQGKYDVRRVAVNDEAFAMDKILALRLP